MTTCALGRILAGMVTDQVMGAGRIPDPTDVLDAGRQVDRAVLVAAGDDARQRVDDDQLEGRAVCDFLGKLDDTFGVGVRIEKIKTRTAQRQGNLDNAAGLSEPDDAVGDAIATLGGEIKYGPACNAL